MAEIKYEIKAGMLVLGLLISIVIVLVRPMPGLKSIQTTPEPVDRKLSTVNQVGAQQNYLAGIDASHYQGKVNWTKVVKQNVHFVYLKATDGITYTDPSFHANQKMVIEQGIPVGTYHFFEPHDDGVKQAENFLAQVKVHDNMLPPVLDVEVSKGVKKELLQKRVRQWIKTVEKKTGCQPVIYSYGGFYETYLGGSFNKYQFWLADYAKSPTLPSGVKQWLIWQHSQTGHVKGVPTLVDKNWFRGSKDDLVAAMCKRSV